MNWELRGVLLLLLLLLTVYCSVVFFIIDSGKNNRAVAPEIKTGQVEIEATTPSIKTDENKVYGIGDEWIVNGQWKLTVNSVKEIDYQETDYRNDYSDINPEQVIVVNYTYENLGYEGNDQGLLIFTLITVTIALLLVAKWLFQSF